MHPHAPGAVLLDIDGTLLDSNDAHAHSWVAAFDEHDISISFERIRPLIGKGGDKLLAELAGLADDSDLGRAITKQRKALFKVRYLPQCRPFPGARALIERLRADDVGIYVATSATADEVNDLLEMAGVADLISHGATSDDAERSKPDPDILHAAIAKSRRPKEALVMLGDTPYDVEAAMRAQVAAVALRSGGWVDADLVGAVAVYDHVGDLLEHYDDSPLAGLARERRGARP